MMKTIKLKALQRNVHFSFCPHPVTIDKSAEWGPENIQKFPNGVYLKHDVETDEISHGVKPDGEFLDKPEGWEPEMNDDHKEGRIKGRFKKNDIWFVKDLEVGKIHTLDTLDGMMNYDVDEPSSMVCQDKEGTADISDSWVIAYSKLTKLYDCSTIKDLVEHI